MKISFSAALAFFLGLAWVPIAGAQSLPSNPDLPPDYPSSTKPYGDISAGDEGRREFDIPLSDMSIVPEDGLESASDFSALICEICLSDPEVDGCQSALPSCSEVAEDMGMEEQSSDGS